MVFDQPICPASYPTSSLSHSNIAHEPVHNDALVYLAVAVATFAAVPSFLWLRDRRHKSKERRRNRVIVANIKAKMDAAKALEAVPVPVPMPQPVANVPDQERDTEGVKDKKKRTKDRRKRNRDPSRPMRGKKTQTSSRVPLVHCDSQPTDYTPRAPEQSTFSPPYMPDIASPMPMSLISFHSSTSSPSPSRSENSSQAGHSRSASASSMMAPLTPSSLPPSHSLSHNIVKANNAETWALHLPHDDPAWDWDGQSSTYSSGSRAPSSFSCVRPAQKERSHTPPSPESPLMSSAPSLVFPSLNAHPPPGASLSTQIASLKGALEASRTREDIHRRDAERWSKECDIIKWKWNEANDEWRRREAELQTQIRHLLRQLQTYLHPIHTASPVAPLSFVPSQPPFPLAMTFPSLHHPPSPFLNSGLHPFLSNPALHTKENDTVNEELVEAILKRPSSIRPFSTSASRSRSGVCRREPSQAQAPPAVDEIGTNNKTDAVEPIVEFEFPTLLERRVTSPLETIANVDGVEIYH